jgi:hypothetical protein
VTPGLFACCSSTGYRTTPLQPVHPASWRAVISARSRKNTSPRWYMPETGGHLAGVLSAGRGPPARTPFGCLVWAFPVAFDSVRCVLPVVGSTLRCLTNWWNGRHLGRGVVSTGRERFELGSSGWSRVLGIDAVGGPPHCDFTNEAAARVTSRWCPDWLGVTLAGMVLGPGRRGRRRVGIALPGRAPRRDGPCSVAGMPGSQGSGPGPIGASAGRRQ